MQALRPLLRARAAAPAYALSSTRSFSSSSSHNLARITITGRLGTQPELQATSTGKEVVRYVVASEHGPQENRKTSWFNVSCFPTAVPQRDFLLNLPKGSLVYVEGDATMRTIETPEGKKRNSLSVVQTKIEVLRRPFRSSSQSSESYSQEGLQQQ
ncbi:hypothetical protein VTN77DRAFT_2949 [Rasamsonia byssochlamydoides]|uniref:uncharacterized protein n=1 Tax=Rasamsonia byssochlamydoides TaxID=89139 RepID=UPI0037422566